MPGNERATVGWIKAKWLVLKLYMSQPQGTVDNNLGPDCLVGPKALDPNIARPLSESPN